MSNTVATRKPTKRDRFERLYTIVQEGSFPDAEDLMAFIDHELELLDKKNAAERKPTPKQIENAGFKSDILAFMEPDTLYTVADLAKSVPSIVAAGISASRVTAMMTQLKNDGAVVRTEDKRKSFYSLA